MILYWLLKRSWYRWLWRHRRVNAGQFFTAGRGSLVLWDSTAGW